MPHSGYTVHDQQLPQRPGPNATEIRALQDHSMRIKSRIQGPFNAIMLISCRTGTACRPQTRREISKYFAHGFGWPPKTRQRAAWSAILLRLPTHLSMSFRGIESRSTISALSRLLAPQVYRQADGPRLR